MAKTIKEINEKIKELKMLLIKDRVNLNKGGKIKVKEIKRTIARLHTFNRLNEEKDLKPSKEKPIENFKEGKS